MKQTNTARLLAAAAAVAGLAAAALGASAQTPPPAGPPMDAMRAPRDRMPVNDAEFVRALDAANTAELDMAKYIVNRTTDPAVHAFAQRMIDDHSTAAVKLEAATRGTDLRPAPQAMGASRMGGRGLARLQGETGMDLDNDYMRMQVPAHRRVLGLLQWESDNGQIAGLKALATALTATVQQHLQVAQTYLAAHNLTPYAPPPPGLVPGHVNPNGMPGASPLPGAGTPNNPGSTTNGGSTAGQNNGTAPSPMPSTSPHP